MSKILVVGQRAIQHLLDRVPPLSADTEGFRVKGEFLPDRHYLRKGA